MKRWDVYFANVHFEDVPGSKKRPVIILDDQTVVVIALKLTTHKPRQGEYALIKWKEAGLNRPTTVRLSKRLKISSSDILHQMGRLHPADIMNLQGKV